jgi:caffeoyl-CoA O-methyltransferase
MGVSIGLEGPLADWVRQWGAREHPVLARCRKDTAALGGVARMQISPEQGAFMQSLARLIRARRVCEVGVFTGYSSTALALVLKEMHDGDAVLVACDVSAEYMDKARVYWRAAGVEHVVLPRVGKAVETLKHLLAEGDRETFDIVFIDADKPAYDDYFECGLRLLRPGGLMLIDNMLWGGAVADGAEVPEADAKIVAALRALTEKIHADARVDMSIATVGDGLAVVVKR